MILFFISFLGLLPFIFCVTVAPAMETDFLGPLLSMGMVMVGLIPLMGSLWIISALWAAYGLSTLISHKLQGKINDTLRKIIAGIIAALTLLTFFIGPKICLDKSFIGDLKDEYLTSDEISKESDIKISEENYVFSQLSFDPDKSPKENVDIAETVLRMDRKKFKEKIKSISTDNTDRNDLYGDSFRYYIKYNEGSWPTVSFKDLSYNHIVIEEDGFVKSYIYFYYAHRIEGENVVKTETDFIIEDIENIFGGLEDEKGLREILDNEKELYYDESYEGFKKVSFNTASGIPVSISSSYIDTNCGIVIKAEHKIKIKNTFNDSLKENAYKDNAPSDEYFVKQIFYDANKSPEENIKRISDEMEKNSQSFMKVAPRTESENGLLLFLEGDESRCYFDLTYDKIEYNRFRDSSYNQRDLSCEHYAGEYKYYDNVNEEYIDGSYLVFRYGNQMEQDGLDLININFVVNDVESVFGKLEDRELFEKTLEEHIDSCLNYKDKETNEFMTESGAIVTIGHTNWDVNINGEYMVEY
jgi:hypothetical protein